MSELILNGQEFGTYLGESHDNTDLMHQLETWPNSCALLYPVPTSDQGFAFRGAHKYGVDAKSGFDDYDRLTGLDVAVFTPPPAARTTGFDTALAACNSDGSTWTETSVPGIDGDHRSLQRRAKNASGLLIFGTERGVNFSVFLSKAGDEQSPADVDVAVKTYNDQRQKILKAT